MQVWNLLHAASWKCRTQTSRQKSPSGPHRTTLSGYIFATKAHIDSRKELVKQQYVLQISSQYGELRHTSGSDLLASLRHPCKIQRVSRIGSVTARHSSGRQPNFAALNRGRHLCSAGWPSRWALTHILVNKGTILRFAIWSYIINTQDFVCFYQRGQISFLLSKSIDWDRAYKLQPSYCRLHTRKYFFSEGYRSLKEPPSKRWTLQ